MTIVTWNEQSFYISETLKENLDNYIDGVLNRNTSAVFLIDGRSGLGKTTLSCQIGCYISKRVSEILKEPIKFSLDSITWNPSDFIEKLKEVKKGDIVILDESMILSNRSAMSEINKSVIIMMSLIRSKQIFVMFNVNSIFDLDKNLPLHRADVLFHLYAVDDKFGSRGRYYVVPSYKGKLKNLYILGKKYYNYSVAKSTLRDRFSKFFPFDQDEYEQRKQEAINRYFIQGKTDSSSNLKIMLGRVFDLLKQEGYSAEKIGEVTGYSRASIYNLIKRSKERFPIDEMV